MTYFFEGLKAKGERLKGAGAVIEGGAGKSIRPNRPERAMTSLNRGLRGSKIDGESSRMVVEACYCLL